VEFGNKCVKVGGRGGRIDAAMTSMVVQLIESEIRVCSLVIISDETDL